MQEFANYMRIKLLKHCKSYDDKISSMDLLRDLYLGSEFE